jgi:diketogulonate reductase-like aldo/keto reductase
MCCRPSAYDDELVYRTTLWYLLLGGRHIDGAHLYINNKAVGRGIREAMRRGIKREEIFVTSKIFPTYFGYESTFKVVKSELDDLGLDYIDLYLLHWPSLPLIGSPCKKKRKGAAQCRKETWEALSELRNEGLIRNVGVSNFGVNHIKELEELPDVAPIANNQIMFNPFVPEHVIATVDYCQKRNITITAYSPLGGMGYKDRALVNQQLKDLSGKLGKSVSQIMLRWALQSGCAIIPGTGNPDHMKENLDVYKFVLSDGDMKQINDLKHTAKGFVHMDGNSFE